MPIELATPDELTYQFNPVAVGSIHFKVRAPNDAHVALTSGPEESDPMVEVFIGGWSNSKSVIRKNRTKPDVAEADTPDILSGNEFRGFWISWDNGSYSVGKEGEPSGFLNWTDPEPFGIGYYGLCTGWGASGSWIVEGSATEIATIDGGDCLSYEFQPVRQGSVEFEVRAASNAHIALTRGPQETEPMYEIMLGGWNNQESCIRYRREKPDKVHVNTPDLLSQGEMRRFLVSWQEGRITVEHKGAILLEWTDPQPFGVSYFGVRTSWGASGVWRLHCSDPGRQGRGQYGWVSDMTKAPVPSPRNDPVQPGWNVPGVPAGTGGPANWVDAAGGEVPDGAVPGGFDGEQLYVARANHEGAILPGKLVPSHGVVYVPWGGGEHGKAEYQVLCGCSPTWVKSTDGQTPPGALEAGKTEEGETLYIGRVDNNGVISLGKVQPSHSVCYIPYGGEEVSFPEYEVLISN